MYTRLPLDGHVPPRGGGDLPFLRGRRERGRIKKPAYARKIWRGIACFGNRIIGSWLWIIQCFILLQYNAVDSSFLKRAPADGGLLVSEFIVMDVNKLASNLEVYKNGTDKSNNDLNEGGISEFSFFSSNLNHERKFSWRGRSTRETS